MPEREAFRLGVKVGKLVGRSQELLRQHDERMAKTREAIQKHDALIERVKKKLAEHRG